MTFLWIPLVFKKPGDAEDFGAKFKAPALNKNAENPTKKTFIMIDKD